MAKLPATKSANKWQISAGFATILWLSPQGKWCQKRDRDVFVKRDMTTLYCDFSALDTVKNTVSAPALVLHRDSNR